MRECQTNDIDADMPDDRITFRTGTDLAKALEDYCDAEDRTPSQVMRLALKAFGPLKPYLAKQKAVRSRATKKTAIASR